MVGLRSRQELKGTGQACERQQTHDRDTLLKPTSLRLCTMRLMLRRATYWISGSALSRVTSGGAIFLQSVRMMSGFWITCSSKRQRGKCWSSSIRKRPKFRLS